MAAVQPAREQVAPIQAEDKARLASLKKEIVAADYEPISDSDNVRRFVQDYFADIPLMTKIAACESRYRHLNRAGNILRGVENEFDVGVMQINEHYHLAASKRLGIDIHTLDGNVQYARYLYEQSGAKPWVSSSPCWTKATEPEIAKR